MKERFIDFFYNMVVKIQDKTGISERQATEIVELITREVQIEYGGEQVYINKENKTTADQVRELWREGWRAKKIAAHLQKSPSWIRRVIQQI